MSDLEDYNDVMNGIEPKNPHSAGAEQARKDLAAKAESSPPSISAPPISFPIPISFPNVSGAFSGLLSVLGDTSISIGSKVLGIAGVIGLVSIYSEGMRYIISNTAKDLYDLGKSAVQEAGVIAIDAGAAAVNNIDLIAGAGLGAAAALKIAKQGKFGEKATFSLAALATTTSLWVTGAHLRQTGYSIGLPQQSYFHSLTGWGRNRVANEHPFIELHDKLFIRGQQLYKHKLEAPLLALGFKCVNRECTAHGYKIEGGTPPQHITFPAEWLLKFDKRGASTAPFSEYLGDLKPHDGRLRVYSSNHAANSGIEVKFLTDPDRTFSYRIKLHYALAPNWSGFGVDAYEIVQTIYRANMGALVPDPTWRAPYRKNPGYEVINRPGTIADGFKPFFDAFNVQFQPTDKTEIGPRFTPFDISAVIKTPEFQKDKSWTRTNFNGLETIITEVRPAMLNGQPVTSSHWRVPFVGLVF